jgi:hypothetical protein
VLPGLTRGDGQTAAPETAILLTRALTRHNEKIRKMTYAA